MRLRGLINGEGSSETAPKCTKEVLPPSPIARADYASTAGGCVPLQLGSNTVFVPANAAASCQLVRGQRITADLICARLHYPL